MVQLIPTVRLLEDAVDYGLGCLADVTPQSLAHPTPCAGWDLAELLCHMAESIGALHEALDQGCVALTPPIPPPTGPHTATALVTEVHDSALALLDVWREAASGTPVLVGGLPLAVETIAFVGALEIAVHGWDIATACGTRRVIPASLAREMLHRAPLVAGDITRPALFGPAVPVPPAADPSDRLVAYLGRRPGARRAPLD